MQSIRVLLQTTIARVEDDWHVGRFSMLVEQLARTKLSNGARVEVAARNLERDKSGSDPTLASLGTGDFDELWLLAVDVGDGLSALECAGVEQFRRRGGGVLTARDHQDLGCSLAMLSGVGQAHHFHHENPDPILCNRCVDDRETSSIDWPNYHSGSNGDVQKVDVVARAHPLMQRGDGRCIQFLPAHPHEGGVGPADRGGAQVIAVGRSKVTGHAFNLVVACDPSIAQGERVEPGEPGEPAASGGRWIAESSFHHFADYNWNPRLGAPSFVTEPKGAEVLTSPGLLDDVRAYVSNAVRWLAVAERRELGT